LQEVALRIPFPDDFVYSNVAAFNLSLMDLRISFADVSKDRIVAKIGVVMPPEQAAVLCVMLTQQIITYEKIFGEIRHPLWKLAKSQMNFAPPDPQSTASSE